MSVWNGKLTRRAGLALGSACFLATVALPASHADASATLALRPIGFTAGSGVGKYSGSDTTGYTLTLPVGSTTFTYDVVVSFSVASDTLSRIQGAIVTTSSSGVSGSHNTTTVNLSETDSVSGMTFTNAANGSQGVFSLTSASTSGQAFGTKYDFKPGVLASTSSAGGVGNAALKGVGPQGTTYSSLVNGATTASSTRFQVTYSTPIAGSTVDALSASVTVSASAAGSTAALLVADGTGSTASNSSSGTVEQAYLAWTEGSTGLFSSADDAAGHLGTATKFGLNIVFAAASTLLKGDFNQDQAFNNQDIAGFVQAISDQSGYLAAHPSLTAADLVTLGDFNNDGVFNNQDIAGFVAALAGGDVVPHEATVPEPTYSSLAFAGLGLLSMRRRSR